MLSSLQRGLPLLLSFSKCGAASTSAMLASSSSRSLATDAPDQPPSLPPGVEDVMQRVTDILRSQEQPAAIPAPPEEDVTASTSTSGQSSSSSSSSLSSRHHAALQQQQQQQQLVGGDPRYGYAVLGGIVPDEAQDDSNLTHLQLHPERQFRHGDTYTPTALTPAGAGGDVSWLPARRRRSGGGQRLVVTDPASELDYKNLALLLEGLTPTGRLRPRRETGLKPRLQARLARSVKLARQMALLPYSMAVGGTGDPWLKQRALMEAEKAAQVAAAAAGDQ